MNVNASLVELGNYKKVGSGRSTDKTTLDLAVVGEADFSVAVHSRLGQAVDRFGSSGIRESHALDVGGQQVLLSRGRGVGGGNPAGDDPSAAI